jgi:hypothetical protein
MIAWMLFSLNRDPSFIAGGTLNNLQVNARAGKGDAFVIEADEYDRMFLGLKPQIEVSPILSTIIPIASQPSKICIPPLKPLWTCSRQMARSFLCRR